MDSIVREELERAVGLLEEVDQILADCLDSIEDGSLDDAATYVTNAMFAINSENLEEEESC